jgi:hypothetical protein
MCLFGIKKESILPVQVKINHVMEDRNMILFFVQWSVRLRTISKGYPRPLEHHLRDDRNPLETAQRGLDMFLVTLKRLWPNYFEDLLGAFHSGALGLQL